MTKFNPNDVKVLVVDVWPFDSMSEEIVVKMQVGSGFVLVHIIVDVVENEPVIGSVEVIDYDNLQ